jgi:hypothetical protein
MSGHTIKTFIDGGGCPCIAVTPWTFINQDTAGVDMLDADWVISSTIFMRIVPRKHTMLVPAGFGIGVNSKRHWGSVDPSMRTQTIPFDVTVVADRPGGFELVLVIVDDWKPELTCYLDLMHMISKKHRARFKIIQRTYRVCSSSIRC